MAPAFRGGVHPDGNKELTAKKAIEVMPAPDYITLPLHMHIGAPCLPQVAVGQRVLLGQKIADSDEPISAPVHATVSGTVTEIGPKHHPNGTKVDSIVIKNDFKDDPSPAFRPVDIDTLQPEEVIARIRDGGIVGHGGAAFPTHAKINSALGKIDSVLINAAECEPYVTSDHRIMLEFPWEVVGGAKILLRLFGVKKVTIGVEASKKDAFSAVKEYLPPDGSVSLSTLPSKYPQGAEKQLIYALLGRVVPSGKLPVDVKCVVFNVDTVAAIYRLFTTGSPMIRRVVTVGGSAIAGPKNLEVRIGTPVEDLIQACGGTVVPPGRLVMGGPMMGMPLHTTFVPVVKGTNAILALAGDEVPDGRNGMCIRCGKCLDICPMKLAPTYIYHAAINGLEQQLERFNALDCIECGACGFICPGSAPLLQGIRVGKARALAARHPLTQHKEDNV